MKDGFDVVSDIRSLINVPDITTILDGGQIYPAFRPNNSNGTNIVVNCLGITNKAFQTGTANINIYAPNISATQEDGSIYYLPNYVKLNALCDALAPYLDAQYKETFHTEITDYGTLLQDKDGGWFLSIQLKYYSIQDNYRNI